MRAARPLNSKRRNTQVLFESASAQLDAAKATQQSVKLALHSEIGGVNTTVAQIVAQQGDAIWQLSQTTIRAPADGYVTVVALTVGARAFELRSAMSFIVENEITLVGMFLQNGFQTIEVGAPVISFSTTRRAASITQKLREFPRASVKDRLPCPGRWRAPTRSAAQHPFRRKFRFRRKLAVIRCGWRCREARRLLPRMQA
jgi:multidrug resistance efflux pump